MRIDFQKYQCKLHYKLTILSKMSDLNSKFFLNDKFYNSIALLGRPIGCFRFHWRKSVLFFIKTSTILSQDGILSTVIAHSLLSVPPKDTVPYFCSSVSNYKNSFLLVSMKSPVKVINEQGIPHKTLVSLSQLPLQIF